MGISSTTMSIGFFGHKKERYSSFQDAMMSLFQMLFGKYFYSDMQEANNKLAIIYVLPCIVIFFYIVMQFFSVSYQDLLICRYFF